MKDLLIIGAGDFGRETVWIAERMNEAAPQWNILGFADDEKTGETVDGYPVLGSVNWLCEYAGEVYVTCAIADGKIKASIWERLAANPHIRAATLIDPSVIVGKDAIIEDGCILCAGTVLAIHSHLHKNCIVNFNCTIGHDAVLEDYCTVHPGGNISGRVTVGAGSLLGTGTKIIQGLCIAPDTVLGAGTVVVRSIEESGTYVGVPAKRVNN